jgi:cytochrome c551/c552
MKRGLSLIAAWLMTALPGVVHAQGSAAPRELPAIRYPANVSAGGVNPAGATLANPYKGDAQRAKAGEGLFSTMNCDGCHGGGGTGWVGPSLADGRWRYGGADDEVFYSVFYGRPKGMPAYGGVLGSEGIWMIVTYLQSLPVPDAVPTQSWESSAGSAAAAAPAMVAAAAPTQATTVEGMLVQYGCTACHAVDKKVVGPAFHDVATKYRNQGGVEAALVTKVGNGGVGAWGEIPMPPNSAVPQGDLIKMVQWILVLK